VEWPSLHPTTQVHDQQSKQSQTSKNGNYDINPSALAARNYYHFYLMLKAIDLAFEFGV
jgi:hypothetical protein